MTVIYAPFESFYIRLNAAFGTTKSMEFLDEQFFKIHLFYANIGST